MSEITPEQKEFITQRAQGCCEYCWSQLAYSPDPFSSEHIIPSWEGWRVATGWVLTFAPTDRSIVRSQWCKS